MTKGLSPSAPFGMALRAPPVMYDRRKASRTMDVGLVAPLQPVGPPPPPPSSMTATMAPSSSSLTTTANTGTRSASASCLAANGTGPYTASWSYAHPLILGLAVGSPSSNPNGMTATVRTNAAPGTYVGTVTCTFTDSLGNTAADTFTLTVTLT